MASNYGFTCVFVKYILKNVLLSHVTPYETGETAFVTVACYYVHMLQLKFILGLIFIFLVVFWYGNKSYCFWKMKI